LISSKSSIQKIEANAGDDSYSVIQSEISRPHTVKIEMKSPGREERMIMTPEAHEQDSTAEKKGNDSEEPSSVKTREEPEITLE
jgi:hypothetical protein